MWVTMGLGATQRISFLWLVGCTFIYTLGELYLSPIGLSLVTKVAPARLVSMLMGMWFLVVLRQLHVGLPRDILRKDA